MYEELKREFDNPSFRKRMKEECGSICCNCSSQNNIEYHHIVPLSLGGTNSLSNIVPLCHKCHKVAHNGRHITEYADTSKSGRKPMATIENNSYIFDMFIGGEIGNKKCNELLGYSKRTTIKDRPEFKRYLKSKGIKTVRNIVDVAFTTRKDPVKEGDIVGMIEYNDGRMVPMLFKDTGINDIKYRKIH